MQHLLAFCLGLLLILQPLTSTAHARELGIDDLLNPEFSSIEDSTENGQELAQAPIEESNIEKLLGPKDNFPFLPDNHRDSGPGKFNSY